MSVTSFAKAIDNIATTVTAAYTAGSGKLVEGCDFGLIDKT